MSETILRVVFFVAIWLPVLSGVQLFVAYKRNQYKKNPKAKDYRWGVFNCLLSLVLYSYLVIQVGWVTAIVGIPALMILFFVLIFG